MSIVKVRRAAQITLPGEIRKALGLKEGDYLQAELIGGTVVLKPVAMVDKAQAWDRLERILAKSRLAASKAAPSEDQLMTLAVRAIRDTRRRRRESRS